MSRRKEYINAAGLRLDGRRPHEIRPLELAFDNITTVDGSCTLRSGKSKVCATVVGPQSADLAQQMNWSHEGMITCNVAVESCTDDVRRHPQRKTRHCEDIAASVIQVMRSVVILSQYPSSLIHIDIEILELDGGEKALAINAACFALINAHVAMQDVVCAFTVGLLDNRVTMDMTLEEIRSDCPLLSIATACHNPKRIVWMESTARTSTATLQRMVEQAQQCSGDQFRAVLPALREEADSVDD